MEPIEGDPSSTAYGTGGPQKKGQQRWEESIPMKMHLPTKMRAFIHGLTLTQGARAGQAFALMPWQSRALTGIFSRDGDALISMGRGAGKSTFCAAIAAASIGDGPLVSAGASNLIIASSFHQGLAIFRHLHGFLRDAVAKEPKRYKINDSAQMAEIRDQLTGASIRVVGNEPRRLHGSSPALVICDELAAWDPAKRDRMLSVLATSAGKLPSMRSIWIGTRPSLPEHPLERARTDGSMAYVQMHYLRNKDLMFQKAGWRQANPSVAHMPDLLRAYAKESALAKKDPVQLQRFRALRLNLGVPETHENVLLDVDSWRRIEVPRRKGPLKAYVLGLDLGTTASMSAAAAYSVSDGTLDTVAVFPHRPDLTVRGRRDGVGGLYGRMHSAGELVLGGQRVSCIKTLLTTVLQRFGPDVRAVVSDRWRQAEACDALDAVGFPRVRLVSRGQGFKDGASDVRSFRRACLSGEVAPYESLLLRSALAEARVARDAAGNEKLTRGAAAGRRSRSRDDAVSAALMAVGEGARMRASVATDSTARYSYA